MSASDLERSVGRARVDDQQLHVLLVEALCAYGAQHLVEILRAVQHRNRDGDDAVHQERGRVESIRRALSGNSRTNHLAVRNGRVIFHEVEVTTCSYMKR